AHANHLMVSSSKSMTGHLLGAAGGINIDTGVPNTMELKAPAGSSVINPLTTLVQSVVDSSGGTISSAQAATNVATSLGLTIPNGQSLTNYDPLTAGDVTAQKAAAQIATVAILASDGNAATATTDAATVVSQLAAQVQASVQGGTTVNLADSNTLSMITAGTSSANSVNAATALSNIADAANTIGNAGSLAQVSQAQSQFLDAIAPQAPTVVVSTITNNPTPTVTVNLNVTATDGTAAVAGDTLQLMVNGVAMGPLTVLVAADITKGSVDVVLPSLSDGSHAITAQLTDASGNIGALSTASTVVVDTIAANAPTVALTTDSGISATDLITNVGTLNITAVEVGATVEYSIDGGTTWTDNATTPFAAVEGANSVQVRQTDAAGNSSAVTTLNFTQDSVASTATVLITGAQDSVAVANVLSGGASVDNTLGLSGSVSAALAIGEQVVIYDGAVRLGVATLNGTAWSYTTSGLTSNNNLHSFTAVVEDAAGNLGVASAAYDVTVNATLPAATVTVDNVLDAVGTVTGAVVSGGVTNDTLAQISGTITGTLALGDGVAVYDQGVLLGMATVVGAAWSFTPVVALAEGQHQLTAAVESNAGLQGSMSAPLNLTVDTMAANAPTVALTTDSGVTGDGITNIGALNITAVEVGATVEYSIDNGVSWVNNATTPFAGVEGVNSVQVRQTDVAGNVSAVTTTNFTLDTIVNAPTMNIVATNNMIAAADKGVNDTLTGTADAGTRVDLTLGAGNVRSVIADVNGNWSYTLVAADYKSMGTTATIAVSATDAAGNTVAIATAPVLTIDTVAPVLTPFSLVTGSDSGVVGDSRTNVVAPTIQFTAELGATLNIEIGTGTGFITMNMTGTGALQTYTLPTFVADGTYAVTLQALDAAGNKSLRSGNITLDTLAPIAPTFN
ncbi:MAG: hypothetical protein HQM07_09570, partial [Zetaproteobacteria bacterium]|nr:hypothetical protein [Zetaproteobacteria bacterium]